MVCLVRCVLCVFRYVFLVVCGRIGESLVVSQKKRLTDIHEIITIMQMLARDERRLPFL